MQEFRSLIPGCPFIALTATATSDTRAVIFDSLLFENPRTILESPNKENISYVVDYMKKNANLSDYFFWLANELSENGTEATRTIIYCQTIKQCALVYTTIKILLGEKIYEDPMQKDAKRVLLEMLHSCTPTSNKEHILESFQSDRGCVRILVATIAFGMGVDCKQVHRTIHFGPAKNVEAYMQESGRAGRDGKQSIAYLLYQSLQLIHVEKDIKKYIKTKSCRREFLMSFFDVHHSTKDPLHLCCDNCSLECKCDREDCIALCYPMASSTIEPPSSETQRNRTVSSDQTSLLGCELSKFHKSLLVDLWKRDSSGNLKVFSHPTILLGFSDIQISQVIDNCAKLFTLRDICNFVEIWDLSHAQKIYSVLQKVFGDMVGTDLTVVSEDFSSDEEDDLLPEDWNSILVDKELAELAIEELSQIDMNDSEDDSTDNVLRDVPATALNALMNLSFDAVL